MSAATGTLPAASAGTVTLGDLTVNRLGYGTMRITGKGIWGPPADRDGALATLRRAVELGVNFIDTADSYGPFVSEELIADLALSCALWVGMGRTLRTLDIGQTCQLTLPSRA